MRHRLFDGGGFETNNRPLLRITKRPTAGGEDDPADLLAPAALDGLEDGRMLGIYGQKLAGTGDSIGQQSAADDERLLVRQAQSFARINGREARRQPGRADDGVNDAVDVIPCCHVNQCRRPGNHGASTDLRGRCNIRYRNDFRPAPGDLRIQQFYIAMSTERDDFKLEPIGIEGIDDIEGLRADAAGGAENREPTRHGPGILRLAGIGAILPAPPLGRWGRSRRRGGIGRRARLKIEFLTE